MRLLTKTKNVVALGGGHGLSSTLRALTQIKCNITAVVGVSDDGGSSGRLRKEFGIVPPGDLRMALAALCEDEKWGSTWANVMQHRFTSKGELDGHAVGNLLLAALWNKGDDPVAGLDRVGSLLKVIGRVLPMSIEPLDIEATFTNSTGRFIVKGQVQVATAKGRLETLRLLPENPTARPESLSAIDAADWIVMGPGSWFSSVLPHLMVPQQREALVAARAKKILILNLDSATENGPVINSGEYAGYTATEHMEILHTYAPDLRFDLIVADQSVVAGSDQLQRHLSSTGGELLIADLRDHRSLVHHDPKKLTSLFAHIAG